VDDLRLDLAESGDCGRHHHTRIRKACATPAEADQGILAGEHGKMVGARKPEIGAEFHAGQVAHRSHTAREAGIITAAGFQAAPAREQRGLHALQACTVGADHADACNRNRAFTHGSPPAKT
jgi:hypothetical protein